MPSVSKAERRVMAIREHHPEQLYKRNRGLLKMSAKTAGEFARTPEKGLPMYTKKSKR